MANISLPTIKMPSLKPGPIQVQPPQKPAFGKPSASSAIRDQVVSETRELGELCEKIFRVYRIRLKYLEYRRQLLAEFSGSLYVVDSSSHQTRERFYKRLGVILRAEIRLLAIIRRELPLVIQRIQRCTQTISNFEGNVILTKQERNVSWAQSIAYTLKINNLSERALIESLVQFIKEAEKKLCQVEERMRAEQAFLDSKETDEEARAEAFLEFIRCWEMELALERNLALDFQKVAASNASVLRQVGYLPETLQNFGFAAGGAFGVNGLLEIASSGFSLHSAENLYFGVFLVIFGALLRVAKEYGISLAGVESELLILRSLLERQEPARGSFPKRLLRSLFRR